MIRDKERIAKRWEEHFRELFSEKKIVEEISAEEWGEEMEGMMIDINLLARKEIEEAFKKFQELKDIWNG